MTLTKLYEIFIEPVISFALPALCIICDNHLPVNRKIICQNCFDELPQLPADFIQVLKDEIEYPYYDNLFVVYQFGENFQKLIHFLKYQRYLTLARYFAEALAKQFTQKSYDLITSVPLNPIKEKERGYNQSALLARELAKVMELEYNNQIIKRVINTRSQTLLNREQRIKNVDNAFICDVNLQGKYLILVDDVITTGCTLNACAKVLKNQKAENIDIAALATPMNFLQQSLERESPNLLSL